MSDSLGECDVICVMCHHPCLAGGAAGAHHAEHQVQGVQPGEVPVPAGPAGIIVGV